MLFYDIILFSAMYFSSFHIIMSSDDWFMIWVGLEINMMMFIIIIYQRYSAVNLESCMKYFFIQSLGSGLFMGMFYMQMNSMNTVMCMVMSYKMGAGPFYFWFPSMCGGISWLSCFLLMFFQKVIPLMMMSIFICWSIFLIGFISLLMGVIGSFNQRDFKYLVAYSSIYHLGWILLCLINGELYWVNYLLMYGFLIYPLIFFFSNMLMDDLLSTIKIKKKYWMIILILSMAGMPPFLGFFLKWFAFSNIISVSFFFSVILVIFSVIMFYVYFRIIYDVLINYCNYSKWMIWSMMKEKKFWLDMISGLGLLLGILISFYIMF